MVQKGSRQEGGGGYKGVAIEGGVENDYNRRGVETVSKRSLQNGSRYREGRLS